ncbi:Dam family site-specific DNA-(adenine-N6)-methyltransferase [bacterium]|nr:Dam family site-specific DNA-(adenine-N6)-methyltransferase [bacterium]
MSTQLALDFDQNHRAIAPFYQQLLKWVGNKQRFAHEIIQYFPPQFNVYYEPFIGSGAVLGTLQPHAAIASDTLAPLIALWQAVQHMPDTVKQWYRERWVLGATIGRGAAYEQIKQAYNAAPNAADLLYLSRASYGGVMRFRQDGYMSTPCGIHTPIQPERFALRVDLWHQRIASTTFVHGDFADVLTTAQAGDLVYCDPPYSDTQSILYGAQAFTLARLIDVIAACNDRGVFVAMSLDGTKKTGKKRLDFVFPEGLFVREVEVHCGRSMLRRFQMEGQSLEAEVVTDRLLLTY